ncbi:MAG TPA: NAD(P)/FAD-dependent oxidoreductase [Burkholderiales bacterium]|nr:NAD(P)/FAD-dependent oxidoreductase [Burkholderiales bacterium]
MSAGCDFLVIGAGPAGMAAAATAARLGIATTLVDEQAAPGGQIYRNVESRGENLTGVSQTQTDWARGLALAKEFRDSGARYQPGFQVWQLDKDRKVYVTDGTKAACIAARRVLIATGAMERPVPIPGWTLPGVMTVGAAQILYKTSQWVPHSGTWIAGSGPLLWLYAAQVIEAGGRIDGILDTTPPAHYAHALRYAAGALRNRAYLDRGMALQRQVRNAGVRVIKNVAALEARGDGQLVAVRYRAGRHWQEQPACMLLLHHGVVPNAHATLSLDATHHWAGVQRCFAPVTDPWGNISVEGYAAAGDCAGIVGAEASALQGQLAALEAARALAIVTQAERDKHAVPLRAELARHLPIRPFLDRLFAPRASLWVPADDVLVCRCESITARQIRDAVTVGCVGPNQMKAFTRCGMGPCQGRMCGLPAAEIVAQARSVSAGDVGVFNVRPPLKPLSMGELAALAE